MADHRPGFRLPTTVYRQNIGGALWLVDGMKVLPDEVSRPERFRENSVPGGRRERLLGTLSWEFRARWTAGKATWNAFAGIPCQVDGGKRHLEHFRRKTVAGRKQGDAT